MIVFFMWLFVVPGFILGGLIFFAWFMYNLGRNNIRLRFYREDDSLQKFHGT